jgi:hypothetical protein
MGVVKGDLRINSITPDIYCNKTAMGLPPGTSTVVPIANKFWENVGVLEEYLRHLYYLYPEGVGVAE